MKSFLKLVYIFLFGLMTLGTATATPTWTVTEDGTFMIHCEASGDISSLDYDMIRSYKKVIVYGGPLSLLDMLSLESRTSKCTSIDLTDAQVPLNSIMAQSFMDFEYLEEFKCPKIVQRIGAESFNNCPNLKKIVLPKALKKIEYESFQNCPKLKVEIPKNVKIGEGAFRDSKVIRIDPISEPEVPSCRFCSWFLDFMGIGSKYDEKKNV